MTGTLTWGQEGTGERVLNLISDADTASCFVEDICDSECSKTKHKRAYSLVQKKKQKTFDLCSSFHHS